MTWFRRGEIVEKATREAMDVIQAKLIDAENTSKLGTVKVSMGKGFRFGSADRAVALA